MQSSAEQCSAEQSRAEQSSAEQSRAEQSRAVQSRAEQSRAEQSRAEQRKGSESTPESDATVDASSRHGHFVPFLPVEFACAKLCFALRAHLPLPQPMSAQIDPAGSAERNAATLK